MSPAPLSDRVLTGLRRTWARTLPWAEKQWIGITLGALAITLVAGALIFVRSQEESATADPNAEAARQVVAQRVAEPEAPPVSAPGAAPVSAAPSPAPTASPVVDAGKPLSPTVKVEFRTYPGRRASVMWGGTRLGFIDRNKPLVVERPRDSGPLDVVIRSPGFVPVHARAYTFNYNVVDVRITPTDKKDTLFGFKAPLPPIDAGAPPL
jgi:hypothetical protein